MAKVNLSNIKLMQNAKFKQIIWECVQEVILQHIKPRMYANIQRVVYDAYTPQGKNPYKRRKTHGGMLDDYYFNYEPTWNGNTISLNIRTKGNPSGKKRASNGYYYELDRLLVDGCANWSRSEWYRIKHPRNFYETTVKEMEHELPILLDKSFKKRGLKINFKVKWL